MQTARDWEPLGGRRPLFMIAGLAGAHASRRCARRGSRAASGYHAGLLSLAAMKGASEDELVAHCRAVAEVMPLVGFYLQPAVGGIHLPAGFWRRFAEIDNVVAIKMAPFNRYRTLDVIRGVVAAGAEERVTLYTGNDDHIVLDLLAPFTLMRDGRSGHRAHQGRLAGPLERVDQAGGGTAGSHPAAAETGDITPELLALDGQVTDCNSALFDVAHDFHGCIAGCHEVLRRQGLLAGHLVPGPGRRTEPRPGGRARPRARGLSAPDRRRFRGRSIVSAGWREAG